VEMVSSPAATEPGGTASGASKITTRPPELAAELRIALARVRRRLRAENSDRELSDTHYAVLAFLDREGPSTPGVLAEYERVRPPSMTKTLAGLEDRGLIRREARAEDRRQVLISLTPTGQDIVRETRRRRNAWLARRLAELEPGERETLAAAAVLLRRLADT
jgi:DNA-binding MarR family transcriptional regulator